MFNLRTLDADMCTVLAAAGALERLATTKASDRQPRWRWVEVLIAG